MKTTQVSTVHICLNRCPRSSEVGILLWAGVVGEYCVGKKMKLTWILKMVEFEEISWRRRDFRAGK